VGNAILSRNRRIRRSKVCRIADQSRRQFLTITRAPLQQILRQETGRFAVPEGDRHAAALIQRLEESAIFLRSEGVVERFSVGWYHGQYIVRSPAMNGTGC